MRSCAHDRSPHIGMADIRRRYTGVSLCKGVVEEFLLIAHCTGTNGFPRRVEFRKMSVM